MQPMNQHLSTATSGLSSTLASAAATPRLRHRVRSMFVGLAAACVCAGASAQHAGDVQLTVVDDVIASNAVVSGGEIAPERIFLGRFGDSGFPQFTSNPGFEAFDATFTPGTRVGWDALTGLSRWDGESVGLAEGHQVAVTFLSAEFVIADTPISGFDLAVSGAGGLHRHLNFFLERTDGESAEPGVYVLELSARADDPDVASSPPFWIVLSHDVDDLEREAAADWLRDAISGPACIADLDGDESVGTGDLLSVLAAWGPCPACPADINGDDVVGVSDLLSILAQWGPCPG
ncbi:MAG: hypothetical protein AB8G96_08465 [Phycisphaerales bacterium]